MSADTRDEAPESTPEEVVEAAPEVVEDAPEGEESASEESAS